MSKFDDRQKEIGLILNDLLDDAMKGDFEAVLAGAKEIRTITLKDRLAMLQSSRELRRSLEAQRIEKELRSLGKN